MFRGLRDSKWRYAVGELFIVVIGILIAFSLDSWWEGRELAQREHRYLLSLEGDFRENQANLEQTVQVQNAVREGIQELVLFGATGVPAHGADSVMGLVSLVLRDTNVAFAPNLRTYRELLNTASLQVLRSDSLRTLLADFDVRAETVGRVEAGAAEGWSRDLTEHLLTRLDLAAHLPPHMLGRDSAVEMLPSTVDSRSLPADRVFRNVMVGRLAVTVVRLSMYRDLQASVEDILRIVALELGH